MAEETLEWLHSAIFDLYGTIGIRNNIEPKRLIKEYHSGGRGALCREITLLLGLDIKCNLDYFNSLPEEDYLYPPARIEIPSDINNYTRGNMQGHAFSIKISKEKEFLHGILGFATILSHELSHIILYVINHPQKENEKYTDLTAMMLGFNNIFPDGRQHQKTKSYTTYGFFSNTHHTETNTTTIGYLNDEEFYYAHKMINSLIYKDNLLRNDLRELKCLIGKIECSLFGDIRTFKNAILNSKNLDKKHMLKLKKFYDVTYIQEYEIIDNKAKEVMYKIDKLLALNCQTKGGLATIEKSMLNVEKFIVKLKGQRKSLNKDITTIRLIKYKNPIIRFFKYLFLSLFY